MAHYISTKRLKEELKEFIHLNHDVNENTDIENDMLLNINDVCMIITEMRKGKVEEKVIEKEILFCECCDRKLNPKTLQWLSLNCKTGLYQINEILYRLKSGSF